MGAPCGSPCDASVSFASCQLQLPTDMADTTTPSLIRFKVELTLETAPAGSSCDEFPSGDLVLDGNVLTGRGTVEYRKESTNKDWLVSQLELSVVEKMCQVARRGIDSFVAGGLDWCG